MERFGVLGFINPFLNQILPVPKCRDFHTPVQDRTHRLLHPLHDLASLISLPAPLLSPAAYAISFRSEGIAIIPEA
jgi:hypothetical protein